MGAAAQLRESQYTATPTAAYRADLGRRRTPLGPHDDSWLFIATEVRTAARAPSIKARAAHLKAALARASQLYKPRLIKQYAAREWPGDRSGLAVFAMLSDSMQDAGALALAACMLDDLIVARSRSSALERGRLLALRARTEWKRGNLEEAEARYERVQQVGRSDGLEELVARGEAGMIPLAQLRGNLPAMRLHAERTRDLAELCRHTGLARLAHVGLTFVAGKQGDHDTALLEGWEVIQLSRGDRRLEAEALQNLGQLMLTSGHPNIAQSCFSSVVVREAPAKVHLGALGGLALASAMLRNEPTVEWSVREVWGAQEMQVPRYQLSEALLECSMALGVVGRAEEAEQFRRAAESIAVESAFHELAFRAAAGIAPPKPQRRDVPTLQPGAAEVAEELAELAPDRLPPRMRFDTVAV